MKMKKILALVMALVLVLSLAACQNSSGSTTGGDSEKKSIGICIYKFDDNFMTTYRKNLEDSPEGQGLRCHHRRRQQRPGQANRADQHLHQPGCGRAHH